MVVRKLLVNKRSTQSAIETVLGIMKFCIPTKMTRDSIPAKINDFQVNEYFFKIHDKDYGWDGQ